MNYMKDEIFYDTNILIYAYDETEPEKRSLCKNLVEEVFRGKRNGVVSNQVLGELFKALVEKLKVSAEDAKSIVYGIIDSMNWKKINYNETTIKKAISVAIEFKAKFWDAVIAETMKENEIVKIYTENEEDFKRIPGIKVINPFK